MCEEKPFHRCWPSQFAVFWWWIWDYWGSDSFYGKLLECRQCLCILCRWFLWVIFQHHLCDCRGSLFFVEQEPNIQLRFTEKVVARDQMEGNTQGNFIGRFLRKSDYIVFTSVGFFCFFLFIYLFIYFFVCSPYNFWKLASILTKLHGYGPWGPPSNKFKIGICRSHGLATILDFVKMPFLATLKGCGLLLLLFLLLYVPLEHCMPLEHSFLP